MEEKKRIISLDIARGICIILMIICHACAAANGRWGQFNGMTGTFFLVFFFVSAGITFRAKSSFKSYVWKQLKKCIVPYSVVTFIYLVYSICRHSISGGSYLKMVTNAFASYIWSLSNTFNIGPFTTIGVGPIWFLTVYFMSSCLFFILKGRKYSGMIIVLGAIGSSITQYFCVLPFTIQDMFIGCLFIWIGYRYKEKTFQFVKKMKEINWMKLIGLCVGLFWMFSLTVWITFQISQYIGKRYLDLGSNNYSIISLPASLTGIILLFTVSAIIEKNRFLTSLVSFCGKETFLILCLHSIDITMVRNWGNRGLVFMFSTIVMYPTVIYIFRKLQEVRERYCKGK